MSFVAIVRTRGKTESLFAKVRTKMSKSAVVDINTQRAQRLEAYIKSVKPEPNTRQFIELGGQRKPYDVYRIPIGNLIFNIRNGRFASELIAKEEALGRRLDATKKDDGVVIRDLLLEQDPAQTEALEEDLIRNGQVDPGIVTFDGAVINANRRMAVFSKLYDESQEPKYEYLLASILPKNVSEKDLWRIEAGLQFAKEFRLEYEPINELLKIREGIERGLSPKEISKSLMGRYSDKGVRERLEVLKHIETYLQLTKRKGNYYYIEQKHSMEKFNSLQSNVVAPLKRKQAPAKNIVEATSVAFALIEKTNRSHWDIRKLSKIVDEPDAFRTLKGALNMNDPLSESPERLNEAFEAASDIVDDREERDKPERLLRRALSAIESIDPKNPKLATTAVRELIGQLRSAIDQLVGKSGKPGRDSGKRKS
jgi:hypothetical protein